MQTCQFGKVRNKNLKIAKIAKIAKIYFQEFQGKMYNFIIYTLLDIES